MLARFLAREAHPVQQARDMDAGIADAATAAYQVAHQRSRPDAGVITRLLRPLGDRHRQRHQVLVTERRGPPRRHPRTKRVHHPVVTPKTGQPALHRRQRRMCDPTALLQGVSVRKRQYRAEPPRRPRRARRLILLDAPRAPLAPFRTEFDVYPLHARLRRRLLSGILRACQDIHQTLCMRL